MKYLVVYASAESSDSTLCANDIEAVETIERKLEEGAEARDFEVFAAEPIEFHVDRKPVVILRNEPGAVETPDSQDIGAQVSELTESFDVRDDGTQAEEDPFTSEQVFSLDS